MVRHGIETLRDHGFRQLAGRRVGLLTNPSAVDRAFRSTLDILRDPRDVNLVALFSPEHGLAASAPDAARVPSTVDSSSRLPIHSLYGDTYRPTREMLDIVDVVVCDLQDVGARFYTYLWTVTHILESAGEYGVEVVILDRTNPLGGEEMAGPLVDERFASFVGRFPIPIQHGMTLGELGRMANEVWNPHPAALTVVGCEGWTRRMTWEECGLPWVPTSPAMPHFSTLQQYPGACLVEGTRLSEGRGTALPFEVVGAPWIDAMTLAEHLNAQGWAGARFRPHTFVPTDSKWRGEVCHGVQVHITDSQAWRPIETWLGVIREIRQLYPDQFEWLPPASAGVEAGAVYHFDRLVGSDLVRQQIDAGLSVAAITQHWGDACRTFETHRAPYLLYP